MSRLALLAEVQANIQNVRAEVPVGMTTDIREAGMFQGAGLAAAQFWIARRFWIEGGAGFAKLLIDRSDDAVLADAPRNGLALLGAAGFELRSRPGSAIDLQARLLIGSYGFEDHVTSASIGVGFSWY